MANIYYRFGETNPILATVATAQAVARFDMVGESSGNVVRAEDEAWVDLATSQRNFVQKFLGISSQDKTANVARVFGNGQDNRIRVDTTGIFEATCASASFKVGDLVGPAKASGNALESQKVVAVATESLAIGRVVEETSSATTVKFQILSSKLPYARQTGGDGGSTGGASALVTVSNGDGATANTPGMQRTGTLKPDVSILLGSFSATGDATTSPSLNFLRSANATVGSNTVVVSGDTLGDITWFGADGTDFKSPAARISALVDTTPGTGDMPGRLVFATSVDGGETLTEAFRIDNAQRLIAGGVAAQTVGGVIGSEQNWGTTAAKAQIVAGCASTTAGTAAEIAFTRDKAATVGTFTGIASGDNLGAITWYGANGTNYTNAHAQIKCLVDATPGASDAPGRLDFFTTPDGSTTLTLGMRIDNTQVVRPQTGLVVTTGTAAAITTTRVLTAADSGGTFSVAKTSAYAITLPTAAAGLKFKFMVLDAGANAVTISSGAAHQYGDVSVAGTNTQLNAITTTTLAATGDIGDWVSFEGIDSTHYLVTGACKTGAKLTFA